MTGGQPTTTPASDADLLTKARQGDGAAFTELFSRHQPAARRLATSYRRASDPDDLVNGAFERVLGAIRRGSGPTEAFRAYLFVTLRRLAVEEISHIQEEPIDEVPEPIRALPADPRLDAADRQLVVEAYESLPDHSQIVLWQTVVEGRPPRELAPVLGTSANAAAAFAYRSREKLRQAYLQAHLQTDARPQCEPHRSRLGAYVRDGVSPSHRAATEAHLDECGSCRGLLAELVDINSVLSQALFPVFTSASEIGEAVVGGAVTGGAGSLSGAAGLARRGLSKARSNPAVVGTVIAAAAALAAALVAFRPGEYPPPPDAAIAPVEDVEEADQPERPAQEIATSAPLAGPVAELPEPPPVPASPASEPSPTPEPTETAPAPATEPVPAPASEPPPPSEPTPPPPAPTPQPAAEPPPEPSPPPPPPPPPPAPPPPPPPPEPDFPPGPPPWQGGAPPWTPGPPAWAPGPPPWANGNGPPAAPGPPPETGPPGA